MQIYFSHQVLAHFYQQHVHSASFYYLSIIQTAYTFEASVFLGFSLYISNTTIKEDGILCFHDTTYNASNIPSTITLNCEVQGRYVISYNTREGNLSEKANYSKKAEVNLCEVEVYGKYLILKTVTSLYDKNLIHPIHLKKKGKLSCNYFHILTLERRKFIH